MKYVLAILIALSLSACVDAQELRGLYSGFASLDTRFDDGNHWQSAGRYSGVFIAENSTSVLILTCGHGPAPAPIGSVTWVRCFYNKGQTSQWMQGFVDWYKVGVKSNGDKDYTNDIGFVVVPKSEFVRVNYPAPTIFNISNTPVTAGYSITLGQAGDANYPTAILAYITDVGKNLMWATPAGKSGRSGSAFYDEKGNIIGMLLATKDNVTTIMTAERILSLTAEYAQWRQKNASKY